MKAILTIAGLYSNTPTLFDNMVIPDGVDKTVLVNNILLECIGFNSLFPDAEFMKSAIGYWSAKELPTWERIYTLTQLEYNPLDNYDRYENIVENETTIGAETGNTKGSRSSTGNTNATDTDSTTETGSNTSTNRTIGNSNSTDKNSTKTSVAGFNSSTLVVQNGTEDDNSNASNTLSNSDTSGATNSERTGTRNNTSNSVVNENDESENAVNRENNRTSGRSAHIHGNIGVTTAAQMMQGELDIYPKINIIDYITNEFIKRFCILVY